MKNLILSSLILTICLFYSCEQQPLKYPQTRKTDQVDTYFGTEVPDPYRWLEDDNSEETAQWVKEQNKVTFGYLEKIPFRNKINKRLTEIWNYPRVSAPWKDGGRYFIRKNSGLQNQNVFYTMESLDSKPEVILDPNTLSEDGTVALATFTVSHDGKYIGYGVSRGGSDWREFFVRDVETKMDLDDHIQWAKFSSIAWYRDGFFYSRYPKPEKKDELSGINKDNKVYYHKIGAKQEDDKLVYEEPDFPNRSFEARVTEDEKYLIIYAFETTSGNAVYFKDLTKPGSEIVKIIATFKDDYGLIDHIDGRLLFMTNHDAPRYKLIAIDVNNHAPEKWVDIIPERAKDVLTRVNVAKDRLFGTFQVDAHSKVDIFDLTGKPLSKLKLPGIGTIYEFNSRKDDTVAFYSFTSFTTPSLIYRYDVAAGASALHHEAVLDFKADNYETKQVFYSSKDGTKIPLFIVHKKGITLDGTNPTLLYGYGGFNISILPSFKPSRLVWLENGGIYASANLRGGGEYGEEWHLAGVKMKKQNVFDDFIAAAKYLIDNNYTSPEKLAIEGRSNGGLLVGAVINQAPELFRVAIPAVGVTDMLRYQKFTIGHYWAVDYGTSEDSKEMFEYLYNYSPLHTIKGDLSYPAVMVTTADHDDRVVPAHSFKYIATLQEKYTGSNPVLIRIDVKAGHGRGKPISKRIEEATDLWAFIFYNMGVTPGR